MPTTLEVGKKLVELCKAGKTMQAVDELYAPNIVSIEPHAGGPIPQRSEGIKDVRSKNEWWHNNHTIHSATVNGPWSHGEQFIVHFKYDVTPKSGPMANKRFTMEEGALYSVKDGKVVKEEFFYDMGA